MISGLHFPCAFTSSLHGKRSYRFICPPGGIWGEALVSTAVPSRKNRKLDASRVHNKWPVAREGFPFILSGIAATVVFSLIHLPYLACLTGLFTVFTVYFFRDPERKRDAGSDAVLSPADGTVIDVREIHDSANPLGQPAVKASIFMSLFNVHVNRIPIEGRIKHITYSPGKFFPASLDKASEQNERNRIILETKESKQIAVIQIAGLIARRIACWVKEHEDVNAGQRYGLIRFGSRLDVYLPSGSELVIRPRQRVRAGETVLGYLHEKETKEKG